jgi:hypothetical protein
MSDTACAVPLRSTILNSSISELYVDHGYGAVFHGRQMGPVLNDPIQHSFEKVPLFPKTKITISSSHEMKILYRYVRYLKMASSLSSLMCSDIFRLFVVTSLSRHFHGNN